MRQITIGLAALLLAGCLGTGCSVATADWEVEDATMDTDFHIRWGTDVSIGFPGRLRGKAKGQGEIKKEATTEIVTPGVIVNP